MYILMNIISFTLIISLHYIINIMRYNILEYMTSISIVCVTEEEEIPRDLTHQTIFEDDEEGLSDPFPTSTSPLEYSKSTAAAGSRSTTTTSGSMPQQPNSSSTLLGANSTSTTIPSAPVVPALYIPQQQSRPKATSYHHHNVGQSGRSSKHGGSRRSVHPASPHLDQERGDHSSARSRRSSLLGHGALAEAAAGYDFSGNSPIAAAVDPSVADRTTATSATSIDFTSPHNPPCFD